MAGISIEKVSCGDEMTCCISEEGDLYIFGTNVNGCLGIGDEKIVIDSSSSESDCELGNTTNDSISIPVPVKLPFFEKNGLKIKSIACGDLHCVALTTCNRVFTWGCGEYGRLGHGDEDDR